MNELNVLRIGGGLLVSDSEPKLRFAKVAELVNDNVSAGYHDVVWNASNSASGVYFLKMVSGNDVFTNKLMLVK